MYWWGTHIWCWCLVWLYNRVVCGRFLRKERTASGHAGMDSWDLAVAESLPYFFWGGPLCQVLCGLFLRDLRTASGYAGLDSTVMAAGESLPVFMRG